MLNNLIQRIQVILTLAAIVALALLLVMVNNPTAFWHVGGEIHDGLASMLQALGIGIEIVFFGAVVYFAVFGAIKLKHMNRVNVIGPNKHGPQQAVVVHERGMTRIEPLANTQIPLDAAQLMNALRQSMQANYQSVNTISRQQRELDRLSEYEEYDEDDEEEIPALPAPKREITLMDVLRNANPPDDEYVIGYSADGKPLQGKLFARQDNLYNGLYIVGDQGQGKSSLAVLVAAYTIKAGGRLLVIDPEMGEEQALTARLGPLAHDAFLLHEIANTPEKVERLLDIAEAEMKHPSDYPVALLVDELSMIARAADTGIGEWAEVGKRCLVVLEDWSTRGRKRRRRPVAMGQFTQGKRSGGTMLRYSMATVCFKLKKKQAQLALDAEDANQTEGLAKGEAIIIPDKVEIAKERIQVVYPDGESLKLIAQIGLELFAQEVGSRSVRGSNPSVHEPETDTLEPGLNRSNRSLEPAPEPLEPELKISPELAYRARVRRVREMRSQGANQAKIIERIWGVTKGGSEVYNQARDEYISIIQQLVLEDEQS